MTRQRYSLVRARQQKQTLWRRLNRPHEIALGSFSHKSVIGLFIIFGVVLAGLSAYADPQDILFHSYVHRDPTTPIVKYSALNNDLREFNTHGSTSYVTCYTSWNCLRLVASSIFPNGNMSITAANVYPGAPVNSTVFNSISGVNGNNTMYFDITGHETGLTLVFLVSTNTAFTLTIHGSQSNSLVCTCTLSYLGGNNILSFTNGLSFSSLLISWAGLTSAANWQQNFGGYALAESKNPVGDLSVAVSKELEIMANFTSQASSCCANNAGLDANYNFGFFLTTNKNLWQNGDPNWNPLTDPNVQLYMETVPLESKDFGVTVPKISNVLFLQKRTGETLQSEDTLGCSGSAYLCVQSRLAPESQLGVSNWVNLNFTASSNAPQAGSATCPLSFTVGGPGCSYLISTYASVNAARTNTTIFPSFQLVSSTYYMGFFLGSKQTTPIVYCFDKGKCADQYTPVTNGCTAASMEIDFCIPNPSAANPSTTDSGGFFGSVGRFLGGVGNLVVGGATGLFNTIVSPISNALSGVEGAFVTAITTAFQIIIFGFVTVMNQVGSWLGVGPIGTNIISFFSSVVTFVTGLFGTLFGQLVNVANTMVALMSSVSGLLGTYWTDLTRWVSAMADLISGFWTVVSLGLGFGIGAGFIIFWIYGIFQALEDFERWQGWSALLLQIVLTGINLMLWLLAIVWNRVLFPMVQIVKGWL